jgi:prepilin peptidase CpaA
VTLPLSIPVFVLLILAMVWDAATYRIPNWLSGTLVLLYPIAIFLSPTPIEWWWSLAFAGLCLVVGFGLFARGWMGGGDVKLLAACSLWLGTAHVGSFLILMGVLGGALALVLLLGRPIVAWALAGKNLPRIVQIGAPVPYGIAIAGAALIILSYQA